MRAIVFDGNSILNRAYYGVRPLSTADGLPTNACYGFTNIVTHELSEVKPDIACMTFDLKTKTFRHKYYGEYKANRKGMPDELAQQLPYAKQLAAALGLTIAECEGFEADDVIGTFSAICARNGIECYIVTGDRDSLQLVSETTTVRLLSNNETKIMTPERIASEHIGMTPRQLIEVKSLMGDASDNIPGVPGIGEKSAEKLISQFGTLDGVYEHIEDTKGALRQKLEAGRELAYISRYLAEIRLDAPINDDLEQYTYKGYDDSKLRELYTRLEFKRMLDSLGEPPAKTHTAPEPTECGADRLKQAIQSRQACLDISDGKCIFASGDEVLCCDIHSLDNSVFESGEICVFSFKDTLHSLDEINIYPTCNVVDLSLLAYVISPSDNGVEFSKLSLSYLGIQTSFTDVSLFAPLKEALLAKQTEDSKRLYEELEMPLAKTLFEMEKTGFLLDRDGLAAYSEKLGAELLHAEAAIYDAAGHTFNINSPKQLGNVLFEELMLPHGKKTKSGYSTSAEVLEELRFLHPIVDMILYYRKLAKLKSTYCDGLLAIRSDDGRIHTTFKQTMTLTGRLSSAEPNLQNIPVRTELGKELRRFFRAADGCVLIDADYSQIELRVLAHLSGDETLRNAFINGDDVHSITASQVFGVDRALVTSEMRSRAKTVNFGIIYGMGDYSLSRDLGVSKREAARYIEGYFARYPGVKAFLDTTVEQAKKDGYVTTMLGRRRYIPELSVSKKQLVAFGERVAKNTPIQGTSADIIKLAMISVERELASRGLKARLILQIHDELIVEAPTNEADEAKKILVDCMQNALKLSVPLISDCGTGKNWFEAKD